MHLNIRYSITVIMTQPTPPTRTAPTPAPKTNKCPKDDDVKSGAMCFRFMKSSASQADAKTSCANAGFVLAVLKDGTSALATVAAALYKTFPTAGKYFAKS